jgi:hypothetical protein
MHSDVMLTLRVIFVIFIGMVIGGGVELIVDLILSDCFKSHLVKSHELPHSKITRMCLIE